MLAMRLLALSKLPQAERPAPSNRIRPVRALRWAWTDMEIGINDMIGPL